MPGARLTMSGMTKLISPGSTPVSTLIGGPVTRVAPDVSLRQAACTLTSADVGLVVVGEGTGASGVISERDITRAVVNSLDLDATRVADVAHTNLLWCDASATVAEAAAEMSEPCGGRLDSQGYRDTPVWVRSWPLEWVNQQHQSRQSERRLGVRRGQPPAADRLNLQPDPDIVYTGSPWLREAAACVGKE
jgi:hypothetical protein